MAHDRQILYIYLWDRTQSTR